MNTQRWQFDRYKLIGLGTLLPLSAVLINTITLPATAQSLRSEPITINEASPAPDRYQGYNNSYPGYPFGYYNSGYPGVNYYSNSNPTTRIAPSQQQPVLVNPINGEVYQIRDRNTVYNDPYPDNQFGYYNPGFYPYPNYYPYSSPNPILINPTIRNSTLINPVIINPTPR